MGSGVLMGFSGWSMTSPMVVVGGGGGVVSWSVAGCGGEVSWFSGGGVSWCSGGGEWGEMGGRSGGGAVVEWLSSAIGEVSIEMSVQK
ncbi:hypothetical protein HanRHA438_Chr11g0522641 [Helianthus annuus]|uniref:Uncharacterized protein n=1 Tax=Helianthus annuus TaxID=4232 RepID=A0A9K3HRW9_HELAN|nr:hypothetical protein HanXRQr2_Chr11g0510431 [Helianthus annuus]KAJ0518908.1 hypothetical protein HanHA89_Chr11g0442701 [Helianthus annuus]KAJ0686909.1 hypothetical protein HanLR1_Chr11g0420011 [Helianthus annuus]KAJ0690714.1 hypothetical protein HanOQP8_Chr11g0420911 [Helianthus annuus]KAJ0872343.1 hypothetical protein HanRHA438_Chr11g0522641 [Helianthus annuus]